MRIFLFQKFVADVLANGHSGSETVPASQSLAQSYGTMDRQEPVSSHVTTETSDNYQQPSYTHDS